MPTPDSLPRDAQSILELAARSMFELFASASGGMIWVDRQAPARVGSALTLSSRESSLWHLPHAT
jgi:hypothetical protein